MKEEILEYFKDINHAYNDCTRFDTLKRMLGELEPRTDWIPVSERLPEKEGMYLAKWIPITKDQGYEMYTKMVCGEYANEYSDSRAVFLSGAYEDGFVESLFFDQYEGCFMANLDNGEEYNVTRFIEYWMPLPKPYKAEGGET